MSIITLTTDFGFTDFYVAALKGKILTLNANVNIVDISHKIKPFQINHAAYVVKNCYQYFPENTIHIIGTLSMNKKNIKNLILKKHNQYFIAADNGIFNLIFKEPFNELYKIKVPENLKSSFPELDIFVDAAVHLSEKKDILQIAEPTQNLENVIRTKPVITENGIKATVIHIDNYENVILNVDKELFTKIANNRNFVIEFRKNTFIDKFSENFADVPIAEKCAFFNSANLLQISLNKSNAASLLGLQLNNVVLIRFG